MEVSVERAAGKVRTAARELHVASGQKWLERYRGRSCLPAGALRMRISGRKRRKLGWRKRHYRTATMPGVRSNGELSYGRGGCSKQASGAGKLSSPRRAAVGRRRARDARTRAGSVGVPRALRQHHFKSNASGPFITPTRPAIAFPSSARALHLTRPARSSHAHWFHAAARVDRGTGERHAAVVNERPAPRSAESKNRGALICGHEPILHATTQQQLWRPSPRLKHPEPAESPQQIHEYRRIPQRPSGPRTPR